MPLKILYTKCFNGFIEIVLLVDFIYILYVVLVLRKKKMDINHDSIIVSIPGCVEFEWR